MTLGNAANAAAALVWLLVLYLVLALSGCSTRAQHYRLAMRRRPVCLHPGRFAPLDGGGVQYMFRGDQPLQRHEPMVLIMRAIVKGGFGQKAPERSQRLQQCQN
jgi:hypothetical protein